MNKTDTVQRFLLTTIIAILIVHYAAVVYGWYYNGSGIDVPLHVMGGFFIGILFYYLFLVRHNVLQNISFIPLLFLGSGFVALVGVGWELYELFVDVVYLQKYSIYASPQHLHFDTLKDLLNDLIGGAVAIGLLYRLFIDKK